MKPIQLTLQQLTNALQGHDIEVFAPITPNPEALQGTTTPGGVWRHSQLAVFTDTNALPRLLRKFAAPIQPDDTLYAAEAFHLTVQARKNLTITYLQPPDELCNPELPERLPRGALKPGRRHAHEMQPWAARVHLHVNNVKAEQLITVPPEPPDTQEGEWVQQPWLWRLHLTPTRTPGRRTNPT